MKRVAIWLIALSVVLGGLYLWLSSQGGPEGADGSIVTTEIPVDIK